MAWFNQRHVTVIVGLVCMLMPGRSRGQSQLSLPTLIGPNPAPDGWVCQVSGTVTTPARIPLAGVQVSFRSGRSKQPVVVETGTQGDFRATVRATSRQIEIAIGSSKGGFSDSEETIEVERDHPQARVDLVLLPSHPDPQLPDLDALVTSLEPRLRVPSTGKPLAGVQLKHFEIALRMLDEDNTTEAAPVLRSVAQHDSGCIECLTLAALASLTSGAWSSATSELNQAARLSAQAQGKDRRMEPFVGLAVLQAWRGELGKAQISLLEALALKPDDPLALCELGRTFLLQGKMAPADRYLARALAHGAGADAHLLRAQALSDLGKREEAQKQLEAFLGGRKPKDLPAGTRVLYAELMERISLETSGGEVTLADQRPAELARRIPELKGLQPDDDQSDLESVLQKTGDGVRALFQNLPDTSSHEEIEMARLRPDGKQAESLDQTFQYLAVNANRDLNLSEYRTDKIGDVVSPGDGDRDFMVTRGFAATPMIFHPDWQEGSQFRLIGRQSLDGRQTIVIAFAERPAKAKMLEEFRMRSRSVVVLIQGLAWIDAATYRVVRMRTELLKPAPAVRLDAQTTDVRFGEVKFTGRNDSFWLPLQVSVLVRWNGRIYRNEHHYSDYAVFQVKTHEQIKTPKPTAHAGQE